MEADTEITLKRLRTFVEFFWWILPNLGTVLIVCCVTGLVVREMPSNHSESDRNLCLPEAPEWIAS